MNQLNPRALAFWGFMFLFGYLVWGSVKVGLGFLAAGFLLSLL